MIRVQSSGHTQMESVTPIDSVAPLDNATTIDSDNNANAAAKAATKKTWNVPVKAFFFGFILGAYCMGNWVSMGNDNFLKLGQVCSGGPPEIHAIYPNKHAVGENRVISITGKNLKHGAQVSFVPEELKGEWINYKHYWFQSEIKMEKKATLNLKRPGRFMLCYKEKNWAEKICFQKITLLAYDNTK